LVLFLRLTLALSITLSLFLCLSHSRSLHMYAYRVQHAMQLLHHVSQIRGQQSLVLNGSQILVVRKDDVVQSGSSVQLANQSAPRGLEYFEHLRMEVMVCIREVVRATKSGKRMINDVQKREAKVKKKQRVATNTTFCLSCSFVLPCNWRGFAPSATCCSAPAWANLNERA